MLKRSKRLPYPSDLSYKEWELIKPHIPLSEVMVVENLCCYDSHDG